MRIEQLREQGRAYEDSEQWQDAWNVYRQVLAIDPAIGFAQEGKARSETIIRLGTRTSHFLAHPELLVQRGTREDAILLVQELEQTSNKGPGLQERHARLAGQVVLANTPHTVTLLSDEKTDVDLYQVGRYGSFESLDLNVLPGEYTVVGHRKGYKDVRLTLRVQPGAQHTTLTVTCSERIR